MRLRRVGLLSALLLLPACGSIMSWSFPPFGRSRGAERIAPSVPAPYAGVAFDVLVVADGGLILLLDLPFSLFLDTAVLPLTLTTWLFRQVPPPQHAPQGSALRDD